MELDEAPFALWDFADFGMLNQEAIPAASDTGARMWSYLDGQHYTEELGDYLLDRVLNYADPSRIDAAQFGSLLTGIDIEQHLQLVNRRQAEYAANNEVDMLDLQESFNRIR